MIGTISINKVLFLSALGQLRSEASVINTAGLDVADCGSFYSPALSGYEGCFELLRTAIRLYKEMIFEDVTVMRRMADKLEFVDLSLARLWGAKW